MAINYIKQFEDGSTVATATKPSYGLYTATKANDDRDVYKNGLWYPASNGGELVANGTFDSDISGWTANTGCTIAYDSGTLLATRTLNSGDRSFEQTLSTEVGATYVLKADIISNSGNLIALKINGIVVLNLIDSLDEYVFVAESTSTVVEFFISASIGGTVNFDNISLFAAEPTLGTPYTDQFTYASKDGKLLGVEIASGQPVDLHYNELAPTLVEDTIQATDMIVKNNVIVEGEFIGKNACTAWVNFDGTTTPPTIRDSFNVSDVVRTSTGLFDIYFEENMDNTNFALNVSSIVTGSATTTTTIGIYSKSTNKVQIRNVNNSGSFFNAEFNDIQIFGGKN